GVPHRGLAVGDRPLPRRGIAAAGRAGRRDRQAHRAAGRDRLRAGAVRHRSHVIARLAGAPAAALRHVFPLTPPANRHRFSRASRPATLGETPWTSLLATAPRRAPGAPPAGWPA